MNTLNSWEKSKTWGGGGGGGGDFPEVVCLLGKRFVSDGHFCEIFRLAQPKLENQ